MKRVCVFCGSSPGNNPVYIKTARKLANAIINKNYGVVYGGGAIGLMGVIAKTISDANGEIIGVIPKNLLDRDVAYTKLEDLRIVDTMHERKEMMHNLSDGFIALPGGFGTFEEIFEAITWAQLGLHKKPCGILNINHYFDRLVDFLNVAVEQGFIHNKCMDLILVDNDPQALLNKMDSYTAPSIDKALHALKLNNSMDNNNEI